MLFGKNPGWMRFLLLLWVLFTIFNAEGAPIYRCPESGGAVQFQQTPCANGAGEEVRLGTATNIWKPVTRAELTSFPKAKRKKAKIRRSARRQSTSHRKCWKAKQRLERVNWSLRRGYKPSQGVKLRQRRRELEAYLDEFCD